MFVCVCVWRMFHFLLFIIIIIILITVVCDVRQLPLSLLKTAKGHPIVRVCVCVCVCVCLWEVHFGVCRSARVPRLVTVELLLPPHFLPVLLLCVP
jgi:hypothetical protein